MQTESDQTRVHSFHWYTKAATCVGAGSVIGAAAPQVDAAVVYWPASGMSANTTQNFLYFDLDTGATSHSGFAGADLVLLRNVVGANVYCQLRGISGGLGVAGLGTLTGAYAYPSRLATGAPVGPAGTFFSGTGASFMTLAASPEGSFPMGKWDGPNTNTPGIAGVRIGSPGNYNYAWVEVTVDASKNMILGRFAFETVPNTTILAGVVPEVNSLSLLAMGGAGLALHRRRLKEKAA